MSKFNVVDKRRPASTGISHTPSVTPDTVTHEGAPGYRRDEQFELFSLLTTRFTGEDSFYESGDEGMKRAQALIASLAVNDETWSWLKGFARWLRGDGNIRTGSIMLAAEAVHARLAAGKNGDGNKELITSVLQRPDEPAEMLAYWDQRFGSRKRNPRTGLLEGAIRLPKPVKRGIADAVVRLYNERGFLRYDGKGSIRMGDVLEHVHAGHSAPWQAELFDWAITVRHGRDAEPPVMLRKVRARWDLSRLAPISRHAIAGQALIAQNAMMDNNPFPLDDAMAGQWEWLLSWLGEKDDSGFTPLTKARQWQLAAPQMGYMALLRNLRNLDEAGIDDALAAQLAARIADPEQVARSRQLPFRFYSAYREAPSLRWGHALDVALGHSLQNIPELPGRTAILIDTSGSMSWSAMSAKSKMKPVTAAALFGMSLKMKNFADADLWGFADGQFEVTDIPKGMSVLRAVEAFEQRVGSVGGGTRIADAVRRAFRPDPMRNDTRHLDRVIILTDMQTFGGWGGDVDSAAPRNVPIFAFNVVGYAATAIPVTPGNNRFELAGLTDHTFSLVETLGNIQDVRAGTALWPWER